MKMIFLKINVCLWEFKNWSFFVAVILISPIRFIHLLETHKIYSISSCHFLSRTNNCIFWTARAEPCCTALALCTKLKIKKKLVSFCFSTVGIQLRIYCFICETTHSENALPVDLRLKFNFSKFDNKNNMYTYAYLIGPLSFQHILIMRWCAHAYVCVDAL